jgi:hypothetical protein
MIYQWFGLKTTRMVFSILASRPVVTVFFGLASKPVATVSWFSSKLRWWRVSLFEPQNRQLQFDDLGLKITAMVS